MAVVVIADIVSKDAVLIGALILGPFLAAFGARTRDVVALGVLAVALSVALGEVDGIFGESDHVVRTAIVLGGCIGAALLTRVRERREAELDRTIGAARTAQRLALALEAGEMGTWRWDLRTGRVVWDARLEALYGLAHGAFDGRFETYAALLHPEDRERTSPRAHGMEDGTPGGSTTASWNDGSTHWLEAGEPVRSERVITGATGVDQHRCAAAPNPSERSCSWRTRGDSSRAVACCAGSAN
jgi:PAS domain-containing protein